MLKSINTNSRKTVASVVGVGAIAYAVKTFLPTAKADESAVHAPDWPFTHKPIDGAYDAASVRRGYFVYKEVCATCHSLNRIAYRDLVGVSHTEAEAKIIAQQTDIKDGFTESGEPATRPGRLADYHPSPYSNEQEARSANNGALPPDLSLMVKARPEHEDYIFSLLTGYKDQPPAGVSIRQGLYYNPYFSGGAIGMTPPLEDGKLEYDDGTPATVSQMAKDVSVFLTWASMPEQDDRKLAGIKVLTGLTFLIASMYYWKKVKFSVLNYRRITWKK